MQWNDIISGMPVLAVSDATRVEIHSVEYDSRAVRAGSLFVAMRGETTDGNKYVRGAIDANVAAIVTDSRETFIYAEARGVPVAMVESGRRSLAMLTANLLGHPERSLAL